ncbi:MAG: tetratricopeptide repeat protein [Caulobacteraceae bacterium]|nr:tetratricopeptide repeat protein [Caulobacteraceae bacterium]
MRLTGYARLKGPLILDGVGASQSDDQSGRDPDAHEIQGLFERALAIHQSGDLDAAAKLYGQILRVDETHAGTLHLLGVISIQTERPDRGLELISAAIEIDPNVPPTWSNLGAALSRLGRFAEALDACDRSIALQQTWCDGHRNRGLALMGLGRHAEAADSFDIAISLQPDRGGVHRDKADALIVLQHFDQALSHYDIALGLGFDPPVTHHRRGLLLEQMKLPASAAVSYARSLALRPDAVDTLYRYGLVLVDLGRFVEALQHFDKALSVSPDWAKAHNARAIPLMELGRLDEAIVTCDRAIRLEPSLAEAHNNRGCALDRLERFEAALESFDQAIQLKSDFVTAHYNRAHLLQRLGRPDLAEAGYQRTLELSPHDQIAKFALGTLCLLRGDLAKGFELYEARKAKPAPTGHSPGRQRRWFGKEDLAGRSIFIEHEQGLGDAIQMSRYLSLLQDRGADVLCRAPPTLKSLLERHYPGIGFVTAGTQQIDADYFCPLMSLPGAFSTTLETIPNQRSPFTPEPSRKAVWTQRLASLTGRRIGMVWRGNPLHSNDRHRSIPAERLDPLLSFKADWISLQTERNETDVAWISRCGWATDLGPEIQDFEDTLAILDQLDLVITVDTSVAHLAGAMGRPVWLLLPFQPDWRWMLDRSDSPWYPSAQLFRQPAFGDWESVIERVTQQLEPIL